MYLPVPGIEPMSSVSRGECASHKARTLYMVSQFCNQLSVSPKVQKVIY